MMSMPISKIFMQHKWILKKAIFNEEQHHTPPQSTIHKLTRRLCRTSTVTSTATLRTGLGTNGLHRGLDDGIVYGCVTIGTLRVTRTLRT